MLYKELAPITKEAWEEIEDRLMEVFKTYLSARRVVKVEGPKGLDFNVITDGRLGEIKDIELDLEKGKIKSIIL